jgi:hypothetical protein
VAAPSADVTHFLNPFLGELLAFKKINCCFIVVIILTAKGEEKSGEIRAS